MKSALYTVQIVCPNFVYPDFVCPDFIGTLW